MTSVGYPRNNFKNCHNLLDNYMTARLSQIQVQGTEIGNDQKKKKQRAENIENFSEILKYS